MSGDGWRVWDLAVVHVPLCTLSRFSFSFFNLLSFFSFFLSVNAVDVLVISKSVASAQRKTQTSQGALSRILPNLTDCSNPVGLL